MGRDGMGWGGVLDGMGWDGMDPEGMGQGTTSMDGSHRIGSGIGSGWIGSGRIGSSQLGWDRIGSDRISPLRTTSHRNPHCTDRTAHRIT